MNTKLLYLILPFAFSGCLVSMSLNGSQVIDQDSLNEEFIKAARNGSLGLLSDLLKKGAQVSAQEDRRCNTALHLATERGHLDCVKILIEAKADVNARNKDGDTALHTAAIKGHLDCLKALIGAQADVNACESGMSCTPLHFAIQYRHLDCVKALIAAKADVDAQFRYGWTALHRAVERRYLDGLKALLEAQADVYVRTSDSETVLDFALNKFGGYLDALKTLLKYSYGFVPSAEAVSESRKRIFNVLLQFVRLRNEHPELDNLKDITLQHEILTRNKLLQEDLAIIFLDELKKGKDIKSVILIRSKEAAVSYLFKKVEKIVSSFSRNSMFPDMATFLDPVNLKENLGALIREGLDERIEQLKTKNSV